MKKWKPEQAEFFGWWMFLEWAKENGVDARTKDDGGAWWDCWKEAYIAGANTSRHIN